MLSLQRACAPAGLSASSPAPRLQPQTLVKPPPAARQARRQSVSGFFGGEGSGGGGGVDTEPDSGGGAFAAALAADAAAAPAAKLSDDAAAATAAAAEERQELRKEVAELRQRVEDIAAQLEQLNDRARERAISMAQAVRAAGEGDAAPMAELQHQQAEELSEDEDKWETLMEGFTQVMSKGYIASTEKIRDRLLISEWELGRKVAAARRGVAAFELHCAAERVDLPFEVLTHLYDSPDDLDVIADPHLRMQARASIRVASDEEYGKVWAHCTAEAQKLAQQFSQTEFVSKLIPESGVLEILKKLAFPVAKAIAG